MIRTGLFKTNILNLFFSFWELWVDYILSLHQPCEELVSLSERESNCPQQHSQTVIWMGGSWSKCNILASTPFALFLSWFFLSPYFFWIPNVLKQEERDKKDVLVETVIRIPSNLPWTSCVLFSKCLSLGLTKLICPKCFVIFPLLVIISLRRITILPRF